MTRNALSIEAVGRRANNVLLPHSIQTWDNDCWSNKVIGEQLDQRQISPSIQTWDNDCWSNNVIEEQLDQRQISLSKLEQYCMGCWPSLITDRYLPQRLNSHQRHNYTVRNLE